MGCDIHIYCEEKRHVNGIDQWVNVDNYRVNPYYKTNDEDTEYKDQFQHTDIYGGRNYRLFAALADVRQNDYVKTPVIAQPRGLPEDASPQTKAGAERWDGDGHSHTYLTMKELVEYNEKHKVTKISGIISLDDSHLLDQGVLPTSWCQGSSDMRNKIRRNWEDPEGSPIKGLMDVLLPHYKDIRNIYHEEDFKLNLEKFRIVFWFDN